MRKWIAIIALVLILAGVNGSIYNKETHLATGTIAYLKLRPVDPRSLMQGDYMALRFEMADKIIKQLVKRARADGEKWRNRNNIAATDGSIVVSLDKQKIASFKHLYKDGMTLASNEIKMQYRVRSGRVKFATNAFFFEEGTASVYEKAKYGQFRVNQKGELLLANMYTEKLELLGDNK